jgi:hypothetical protein
MYFIWLQVLGQLVPRTTICARQTLKPSRPMVYKTREACPKSFSRDRGASPDAEHGRIEAGRVHKGIPPSG